MKIIALVGAMLALLASPGRAATGVPIEVEQNLVIMQLRVGTSPPLSFLVDTGASATVIASDRLAEAGLSMGGTVAATAQGGDIEAHAIRGAVLRFGGISLAPQTIAAVDLAGLSAGLGRRIDGILGRELFERYTVRFDYDRRHMTLFAPGERGSRPAGTQIPIEIRGGTPFVAATVTQDHIRLAVRLLIDTGAGSALTLYADFVAAHSGIAPGNAISITGGALLPGQFRARVGRIEAIGLGRFRFVRPVVNFSASGGGDDAAPGDAGQIGGELLSRFTITFDYRRGRMTMTPNSRYRAPFAFDASGLSLAAASPDFAVKRARTVLSETPAAEAGLARGDEILRIDGVAASGLSLGRLRALLRIPGRTYRLEVLREGRIRALSLTTRTLV